MEDIFVKRLIELRETAGLSQRKLAKTIGVSFSAVQNWEKNKTNPDGEVIIRLAKFFNVSANYILGLSDKK